MPAHSSMSAHFGSAVCGFHACHLHAVGSCGVAHLAPRGKQTHVTHTHARAPLGRRAWVLVHGSGAEGPPHEGRGLWRFHLDTARRGWLSPYRCICCKLSRCRPGSALVHSSATCPRSVSQSKPLASASRHGLTPCTAAGLARKAL